MEEVQAMTEDARLVVGLDAETLPGVQAPQALLQLCENVFCHRLWPKVERHGVADRFLAATGPESVEMVKVR
jgi:hypothetical protein